jgi:hypothetical protein
MRTLILATGLAAVVALPALAQTGVSRITTNATPTTTATTDASAGGVATIVPEGTVSVIGTGGAGTGIPASAVQQQPAPASPTSTPLFDQVAREGLAKDQRRRARGEEPRIIGIAPRTENDLSHQLPDDRIIRY